MTDLPRFFAVYNDKGLATFDPGVLVIRWQNCGMGDLDPRKDETLWMPRPIPPRMWNLFDREDPEQLKKDRMWWWTRRAMAAFIGDGYAVSYDPFSWDPAELRTAGWWLRMKRWVGVNHAAAHMSSRRAMVPYLTDYAAWGTDVYPPIGYSWEAYYEWAQLKIGAHVRVCTENKRIPVVLLHLDRDLAMQARLAKLADKRIRWGLWSDPKTWEDVVMHAQAVRAFMGLVGEGQVTQ